MAASIRIETTVSPDGNIEVHAPDLTPGQRVTVIIEPAQTLDVAPRHVIDIVKDLPGQRAFQTADEVDAYIREERDSWDR